MSPVNARSLLYVLPLLAAGFAACAGGACGDEPAKETAREPGQTSGKSSGGSGSGQVDIADWDKAQRAPEPAVAQQPAAAKAKAGILPLTPSDLAVKVLAGKGLSLVLLTTPKCDDCGVVAPVLQRLAPEFAQWQMYSLERSAEAATALPPDMRRMAPPGFLMFDGGKALGQRAGLPFSRDKKEKDEDYQRRLELWLRDALTQKSLSAGKK